MKLYHIYQIDKNGEPKEKQRVHAHNIDNVWKSNKSWYTDGTFLVTSADGSETKLFTQKTQEPTPPLCVCERCLMAIESREGKQITRQLFIDEDAPRACDWCENDGFDTLYEIL